MHILRGLNVKWAAGAVVLATALFLMFEAGKASGSRGNMVDGDAVDAGPARFPQVDSRPMDREPANSGFESIRLASASVPEPQVAVIDEVPAEVSVPETGDRAAPVSTLASLTEVSTADVATRHRGLPDGKWTRESMLGRVSFEVSDDRIHVDYDGTGELTGMKASMWGEFATASDGTVFGLIHAVDVNVGALGEADTEELLMLTMMSDLPFAMRVHSEPDAMVVKSMTVGMPAMFAGEDMSGLGVYARFLCGNYEPGER